MFENKELQQRYQNDPKFKLKVDKSELDYQAYLAKATQKKSEIQECIQDSILEKFTQESSHSIYFFYGFLQPSAGSHTLELSLFFLQNFHPQPNEKFVFVYFNNQTPSSDYYFEFKNILTLLPLRLVQNLQDFILVKPYFYIKAHDYVGLGSINKIFSQKYRTLENCSELCSHLKIETKDFVSFVPEEISAEFPKNIKRRPSLINYRFNLQGQNLTESQRNQKNEFQMAINSLITKQVYRLQNYELGEFGIPIIIQLLIHYFRTKPQGLKEEGIFRKSVSIDEENETLEELSQRNYEYLEQIKNPHLIACLIKRFFTNLKEPIIPYATYDAMLHDQGVTNKKQHVKKHVQGLPKLNFMTIAFLLEFLIKDVLPNEKCSKMSANNLAICFSPSLMRSEKASMADLINASKSVNITNIMLTSFEEIFGNEEQRLLMYKKSAISKKKDFTKAFKKELDIQEEEKPDLGNVHQSHESRHSSVHIDSVTFNSAFLQTKPHAPSFSAANLHQNEMLYPKPQKHQEITFDPRFQQKREQLSGNSTPLLDLRSKSAQNAGWQFHQQQTMESNSAKQPYFGTKSQKQEVSEGSHEFAQNEAASNIQAVRKSRINFNSQAGNSQK